MKFNEELLTQAFINCNNRFMEELPESIEVHGFSRRFEKKMSRLISADKKYGGRIWLERFTTYAVRVAVIVMCLITINFVSVKAFGVNIWQVIVTKTEQFININFIEQENEGSDISKKTRVFARMKIANIPEGYTQKEFYREDNMTVQHLVGDNGTVTYTESLITETADVNIATGKQETGIVDGYEVSYVIKENSITAFFSDAKFYHIVQVQGKDANIEFANQIIEELEEQ